MASRRRIIDLSVTVDADPRNEPWPPSVRCTTHRDQAQKRASAFGITADQFPGGMHLAIEEWTLLTHVGTHIDAPWHYGPTSGGQPARTVEQVPLEWCYGPGVVLDVSHRKAGESITVEDLVAATDRIGYRIQPLDIVLLYTGVDKYLGQPNYTEAHPGLSREGVFWLLDQGVRMIGIDAYSLDKPFARMAQEYREIGLAALFPAHYAGREREYCQIEKLCNLDQIPVPYGFTVSALPVKLAGSGGAWCRAVAIVDE